MMQTRCPACSTVFRITPEQIRVRHGQVRCGRCQRLFNALDSLLEAPIPSRPPQPVVVSDAVPSPALPGDDLPPLAVSVADTVADTALQPEPESREAPEAPAPEPSPPVPEQPPPVAAESCTSLPDDAAGDMAHVMASEAADDTAPPGTEVEEPHVSSAPQILAPADISDTSDTPAEFGEAPAAETEQKPPGRYLDTLDIAEEHPATTRSLGRLWALVSALSLLALTYQILIHFRIEIAAAWPQARPALQTLCAPLDCRITLPRRVDLLDIATSELRPAPRNKDWMLLSATIKNRGAVDLMYPHLELTLIDGEEQPVLRKILAPADYLTAEHPAADGFGAKQELELHLALNVNDTNDTAELSSAAGTGNALPAAGSAPSREVRPRPVPEGYRLFLFYP